MAEILKGAPVAEALGEKMKRDVESLKDAGVTPTLAIVRVGEKGSDLAYEKGAVKRCESVGVAVRRVTFPESVPADELLAGVKTLNADTGVHGILILRPLPEHIDDETVRRTLSPEKDVDGITDGSLAAVMSGRGTGFYPCTAQACMEILDYDNIECKSARATVIGASLVVGLPTTVLLTNRFATVTNCHIFTKDVPTPSRGAEILVSAAGKAGLVGKNHVSPGQIVIDVGINFTSEGKMVGDVAFDEVEPVVKAITPVPGGVGTVTTSVLVSHVVEAAKRQTAPS
jgi:methylenetetrahydrofolate dehydrogenase (NADP+)/methenyltetrahydrofolate cyclohydrolase